MHPETHYRSGQHVHHAVLDWRRLRRRQQEAVMGEMEAVDTVEVEEVDTGEMEAQHTQQLDYLYTQLDSLKQNMRDKQTTLAHVSTAASDSPSHKCTTFTKPIHLLLYRIFLGILCFTTVNQ